MSKVVSFIFNLIMLVVFPFLIGVALAFLITGCSIGSGEFYVNERIITPEKIEGTFYMKDTASGIVSGPVVINSDEDDTLGVLFEGLLVSENFNRTNGTHPKINKSGGDVVNDDTFIVSSDVTYSSTNDLEKDGTDIDLGVGKKYTIHTFIYDSKEKKLNLLIQIFNNSIGSVGSIDQPVITREFESI